MPDPFSAPLAPLRSRLDRQRDESLADARVRLDGWPEASATGLITGLADALERRLASWLGRAFAVELHLAREEGRLRGASPEARFADFVDTFAEKGSAAYASFPVLERAVDDELRRATVRRREFVDRLAAARDALVETFGLAFFFDSPRGEIEARSFLGDPHHGGRSVTRLVFRVDHPADRETTIYYKPRGLAPEARFADLVRWLDLNPPIETPRVLDFGGDEHGFVAGVEAAPCADDREAGRFFERLGALLALGLLVGATDWHHGNLVAAGEHPHPIDLETLLHPRLVGGEDPVDTDSILRTGLFPTSIGPGGGGGEEAALAAREGRVAARKVLRLVDEGTDRQRWEWREETLPAAEHGPRDADGRPLDPSAHVDSLEAGFRRAWERIARGRDELRSPDGPLAVLAEARVRVVPRPTRVYTRLLQASWHPSLLVDPAARSALFDRLALDLDARPFLAPLLPAERRALERGDVPVFRIRGAGVDLELDDEKGTGSERVEGFLAESGLDRALHRLDSWDDATREREAWLLRRALWRPGIRKPGARVPGARHEAIDPLARRASDGPIDLARSAGEHLARLAFRSAGDDSDDSLEVDWLEMGQVAADAWAWREVGPSLYGGLAGLAVAFAQLGDVTADRRFESIARAAARRVERLVGPPDSPNLDALPGPGAFTGWGGVVYAGAYRGLLRGEKGPIETASRLARSIDRALVANGLANDPGSDLASGLAGWIVALLRLDVALRRANLRASLEEIEGFSIVAAAERAAERLLERAAWTRTSGGEICAWPSAESDERRLCGLAHGVSGIAWALAEMAARTPRSGLAERCRAAALGGVAWERERFEEGVFEGGVGEWPDLRPPGRGTRESTREPMTAWCHGSPGVAVARRGLLDALGSTLDPDERRVLEDDLDHAVAAILRRGTDYGPGDSLCHGRLGNLAILDRALRDPAARERAEIASLSASLYEDLSRDGFVPGAPAGLDPPGLMVGRAGLVHGLLVLAEPRTPSVLALELPAL